MAEDLERFCRRYLCSRCWRPLVIVRQADGSETAECSNRSRCNGRGYVTARYVERRRSENWGERAEVLINYPTLTKAHAAIRARVRNNPEAVLRAMGF
jgi:hypothetical protein